MSRSPNRIAIGISVGYFVAAAGWLVASDRILGQLVPDWREVVHRHVVGGIGFICITAILLYAVLSWQNRRWLREVECRRNAEKRLAEFGRRLGAIIAAEPECLLLASPAGKILEVNPAGLATFEADSTTELRDRLAVDFVVPEHQQAFRDLHQRVINGGAGQLEFEAVGSRGRRRWLEAHAVPLRDERDGVIAYLGLYRDITERKRLHDALTVREAELRATLYSIGDAVLSTDINGRVVILNSVAEALTGWSETEAKGTPVETVFNIVNEYTRKPAENPIMRVLREGRVIGLANHTMLISRDGRENPIADAAAPVQDAQGRICGVVMVFRDQTAERRAETILRRSEASLATAQAAAHLGSWELNLHTGEGYWSKEMFRLFDRDPKHGPPSFKDFLAFVHPDDRDWLFEEHQRVIGDESRAVVEFRANPALGPLRYFVGTFMLERNGSGVTQWMICTVQDVTERQQAARLSEEERTILEYVVRGCSLPEVLERLVAGHEQLFPNGKCSILLLDEQKRLRHGASVSLPQAYCQAIDGVTIGPRVGSCGTAAYRGERVVVADIDTDPLWVEYRILAQKYGLKACWSQPIMAGNGEVLGTFAVYYAEPRTPAPEELQAIERAAVVAALALERTRADVALRESEGRLRRTNRTLQMISECNQSLVRSTDEQALLKAICQIAVEHGGHRMAWVGFPESDPDKTVRPVAYAGMHDGYVDAINASWGDNDRGRGPAGQAIRSGKPVTIRDTASDPVFEPWRAAAMQRGYASAAALPLTSGDAILGCLSIYSSDTNAFPPEEIDLLVELAGDLAYGITALRTQSERNRLFNHSLDMLCSVGFDGNFQQINPAWEKTLGWGNDELLDHDSMEIVFHEDRDRAVAAKHALAAGKALTNFECRYLCRDGSSRWLAWNAIPVPETRQSYAVVRDITDKKRNEALLQYRLNFEKLISSLSTRFINIGFDDVDAAIIDALRQLSEFTKVDRAALYLASDEGDQIINTHEWCAPGVPSRRHKLPDGPDHHFQWSLDQLRASKTILASQTGDLPLEAEAERQALETLGVKTVLTVPLQSDGRFRGFLAFDSVHAEKDWTPDGADIMKVAGEIVISALERKKLQDQLVHDSLHDPLTGLPNRTLFMDRLTQSIARAKRHKGYLFAILFLDLDRFKLVNDGLGHHAGDRLLKVVASRLQSGVRPDDTVARLGGDEFAIQVEDIDDADSLFTIIDRIQAALQSPVNMENRQVFVTASIGIAFSDSEYESPEDLLRNADVAMYRAKEEGKARYMIFNSQMQKRATRLLNLENDLRRAIVNNEFFVQYQPIVAIRDGGVVGFEALLRWQHPQEGLVSPAEFIPLAEENGLIVPIGEWVLREACGQMVKWLEHVPEERKLTITVNVSSKQITHGEIVKQLKTVLGETGLPPSCLGLELTETVIMQNPDAGARLLEDVASLGLRIYMDDFGTGYSSLSYLQRLPIDTVKIDRSFVSGVGRNPANRKIVKAVLSLARGAGLRAIAEGVESLEDVGALKRLRCELAQGYHYSKPLDAASAGKLVMADTVVQLPLPPG